MLARRGVAGGTYLQGLENQTGDSDSITIRAMRTRAVAVGVALK